MKELTPKQQQFAREYLKDLNATQAAIRAGYSEKTAKEQGARLLTNVHVASFVQKEMDKRAKRTEIDANDVLREIARLAFVDPRNLFDERGRLKPVTQLPDNIAASVASVEVVTSRIPGSDPVDVEYTSKIKFWDKRASLELLGKHLKLFTDKIEHTGKDGAPIEHKHDVTISAEESYKRMIGGE